MENKKIVRRCLERELLRGSHGCLIIKTTQANWDKHCSLEKQGIPIGAELVLIGVNLQQADEWLNKNNYDLVDIDPSIGVAILVMKD